MTAAEALCSNEVTRNPYVWSALAICLLLLVVACHIPAIAGVLHLVAPDARLWTLVARHELHLDAVRPGYRWCGIAIDHPAPASSNVMTWK